MLVKTLVYMAHSSATLAMYKISWEIYSHLDLGHSGKVISHLLCLANITCKLMQLNRIF